MTLGAKGDEALKLLIQLNDLGVEDYQKILKERIGEEVLTVFESYCREIVPEDESQEVLGTLIHLMITGYLISSNNQKSLFEPLIQMPE